MKGFPRTINTKQDVLNLIGTYPEQIKLFLQGLIDSKMIWNKSELEDGDDGITDSTHKVSEVTDENNVVTDRLQHELIEDPTGPIFRMGFESVAEAEALI